MVLFCADAVMTRQLAQACCREMTDDWLLASRILQPDDMQGCNPPELLTSPVVILGRNHCVVADDAPLGTQAALNPAGTNPFCVSRR